MRFNLFYSFNVIANLVGRVTSLDVTLYICLLADGIPVKQDAKDLGVSVPTLYRWLPASQRAYP